MSKVISKRIAEELSVREAQVSAAVALLDEGATVPFISRYRKEVTGGLDDTQMRQLEERLNYLRELEDRRQTVLASIEEQGKLSPALKASILQASRQIAKTGWRICISPTNRNAGPRRRLPAKLGWRLWPTPYWATRVCPPRKQPWPTSTPMPT
jgi:hypothetical protein